MNQPKGTQGNAKTASAAIKEINRLMEFYSLTEIGEMVDRSAGILSSIRKGETMPPDSLLAALRKIKSKKKEKGMKMSELVLSEVANHLGIRHGSADTAEDVGKMIIAHVESQKPLELSERETSLVKQNREAQVDMLLSEGFANAAQAKILKSAFVSEDLMLSEGEDALSPADRAFSALTKAMRAGKQQKPDRERSGSQDVRHLELAEEDTDGKGQSPLEKLAEQAIASANAAAV